MKSKGAHTRGQRGEAPPSSHGKEKIQCNQAFFFQENYLKQTSVAEVLAIFDEAVYFDPFSETDIFYNHLKMDGTDDSSKENMDINNHPVSLLRSEAEVHTLALPPHFTPHRRDCNIHCRYTENRMVKWTIWSLEELQQQHSADMELQNELLKEHKKVKMWIPHVIILNIVAPQEKQTCC